MALALEKIFLQKVAQMPQKEVEVSPHAAKGKGKKSSAPGNELNVMKSADPTNQMCLLPLKHYRSYFIFLMKDKDITYDLS